VQLQAVDERLQLPVILTYRSRGTKPLRPLKMGLDRNQHLSSL
jgi:hypothetical protein